MKRNHNWSHIVFHLTANTYTQKIIIISQNNHNNDPKIVHLSGLNIK